MNFKEYLSQVTSQSIEEALYLDGDVLRFDQNVNDQGISTSFGKNKKLEPFKKTIIKDELISYSLYRSSGNELSKALKDADLNSTDIAKFLDRSAIYANRVIRSLDTDIIVSPVSSSPLAKTFQELIQKRNHLDYHLDSFRKTVDLEKVHIHDPDGKLTDKIRTRMATAINTGIRRGGISVKQFLPHHRQYIRGLFDAIDEKLTKKVLDKNVLIIDDIMTSGSTAINIYDVLKTHGQNNVAVLTILRS